jgi:hypothetical protein
VPSVAPQKYFDEGLSFLHNLARGLLLIANDPNNSRLVQMDAIRDALPYTAETIAQRNERLNQEAEKQRRDDDAAAAALHFDFGSLTSAKAILRAQQKVLKAVGQGALVLETGHRLVAMADTLRRSHTDVVTEERLLDFEISPQRLEVDR